jgi:hypothetical protein
MPRITLAHHRSHEILDSVEIGNPTWHLGERVAPQGRADDGRQGTDVTT